MSQEGAERRQPESSIGPYRIVRRLGAGGMGEVYLAFDERLGRLVALKRIRSGGTDGFGSSRSARERFRREARAAARLSHPFIVQIHDLLEDPDGAGECIVMEYIEGRSLGDLLREGSVEPNMAVRCAEQIARGLDYAHRAGLVHRDLKPSNVMVGKDGRVRILDFGLATAVDTAEPGLTEEGAVVGTFAAMAPEQATGETVDGRADLFSLGVLLFEMLAGRPPFRGKTAPAVLQELIARPHPPLDAERPGLPPALVRLVDSLLAKSPVERPATANEVAEALRGIAAGLPPVGTAADEASGTDFDSTPTGWAPLAGPSRGPAAISFRSRLHRFATRWWPAMAAVGVALVLWLGQEFRNPAELLGSAGSVNRGDSGAPGEGPALRVAVLPVEIEGTGAASGSGLAATQIAAGLERGLLALTGITPVDPGAIGDSLGSAVAVARAVAVDEVVTATLIRGRGEDQVFLKRIRGDDGTILWTERIPLPTGFDASMLTANALAAALRRAFPSASLRPGFPDLGAGPEDYVDLLRIRRDIEEQRGSLEADLVALEALRRRAPRLIDAHVLSAQSALSLYRSGKDPDYLRRAREALEQARPLARDYPPLLRAEVRLAIVEGRSERAGDLLDGLEDLVPGDPWIPRYRAHLAVEQGRVEEAAEVLRTAVDGRWRTWRNLAHLGDLESDLGNAEAARARFEDALALVPEHPWLLGKLARFELLFGDLERAETLYGRLVAISPHRSDLTNLGLVHYLRRDFEAASGRYRQALDLSPGHLTVTLNLADAEAARGRRAEARRLYSEALTALEELAAAAPLQPVERTMKAQCLLGLGRRAEALEQVRETLAEQPASAEVLFQAALVFAGSGLKEEAVELAREALDLGLERRWLTVPGFDPLRGDPSFRSLLGA